MPGLPGTADVPPEAVDVGSDYSADGACADSVEWLLAEMLRGNSAAGGELPQRLRREGFWEALESEARQVQSVSGPEREDLLKAMWGCVRKFSVGRCAKLIGESRKATAGVAGRDVTVVLGYTGAGKTTLMHVLRGSQFEKDEHGHLRPVYAAGNNDLRVGMDQGRSETRFVRLVDVAGHLFADTPGFQDTDGPEVEVANVLGVAEFLQACRSVRLVVLVSGEAEVSKGQGLRLLAGMLGSLLRDPEVAMRSTTFLYTKVFDTHQGMYKKVCDVYKVAEKEDDKVVQCILGELKRQAAQPRVLMLDSCYEFEEEDVQDAADGKAVLLRPCGEGRYDVVYGGHGTEHHATVSLPHLGDARPRKLEEKLRDELLAALAEAGAPPLFLGPCVSVCPLDPACAGKVLRAVQAPRDVFGLSGGVRPQTTVAVREQAALDVAAIQSSVAYCASLAGGADTAEHGQEEAAVWRTVAGRLERLVAMRDLLRDVRVDEALQKALSVVCTSLQKRLDDAKALVGRVAGPDARLTDDDTRQVQCVSNGIAAARVVLEKLVPDVAWDVLAEKVMWHLREYGKLADAALKDSRPEDAAAALQQLQMLATQTCVEVPHEGHTGANVRDAAVSCARLHFERLCKAVREHIKTGAWHTTEALQGMATALSVMCVHHTHLHAVLGLGDLASTGYEASAEALREGLSGLEQACVRDAQELAGLRERDDERQQRLAAQLRNSLTVLVEAEGVCWQHIETSVLQEFVRNAHGACVSAVQTLCDRVVRAVKVGTGADGECAQEIQGEDVQLCTDIIDVLHKVHCRVTADTQAIYTEMQVRVNEAAAVAVAEVGRQVDAVVTADGTGAGQRDQAAELVRYIKQLQQQPALSRYSQGGQGLLAAVRQACKERVGREILHLEQDAPPVCGSADELLAYCTRMCGVMAVVPLGQVLPEMHDKLVAAEAAHTRCVLQRLACIEAVIPASGDHAQTALAAHVEGKQGEEDPDLQLFYDRLKRQQAARGVAALARVGEVQRMVHGVAAQAAQRVVAGLRDYIYGGPGRRTFAGDVCTVLEKSMSAVAAACQSCGADTHTEADASDIPPRLSDHVGTLRRGLLCLKEVEAAAIEGVDQDNTVREWEVRLHTDVLLVLETWLVGDAHIADVNAVMRHLLPLDAHTHGRILVLNNRCTERYVNQFNLNDSVFEEAVKAVDAGPVRQRLDFLQKSPQGEQNYKLLQCRWRDRVQELLDSRLPTFRPVGFEAAAGQLRKIHKSATEVLLHFPGDQSHLGTKMLQELQRYKDRAAGSHLRDQLYKSLLDPLKCAIKYRLFAEANCILGHLDQTEDALRNLLSDGLRQDIKSVRDQYQQEREALLKEYHNWDAADKKSPALMKLKWVLSKLDQWDDLTQKIEAIVDQKVQVYVEEKAVTAHNWDIRSLSHLEMYLPKDSWAHRVISDFKKDMKTASDDAHARCKMLVEKEDYEGALSVCKQFRLQDDMDDIITQMVKRCQDAVCSRDMDATLSRLNQLKDLSKKLELQLGGTRLSDLEHRIATTLLYSLNSVAVALSKHSDIDPADEAMVIAARTKATLWQLVGDRGKPLATDIEMQLVYAQQQLAKSLQSGVLGHVAKLLRAADALAKLRAAFAGPTDAGECVLRAEDMRQTVESAVADRVLPPPARRYV